MFESANVFNHWVAFVLAFCLLSFATCAYSKGESKRPEKKQFTKSASDQKKQYELTIPVAEDIHYLRLFGDDSSGKKHVAKTTFTQGEENSVTIVSPNRTTLEGYKVEFTGSKDNDFNECKVFYPKKGDINDGDTQVLVSSRAPLKHLHGLNKGEVDLHGIDKRFAAWVAGTDVKITEPNGKAKDKDILITSNATQKKPAKIHFEGVPIEKLRLLGSDTTLLVNGAEAGHVDLSLYDSHVF